MLQASGLSMKAPGSEAHVLPLSTDLSSSGSSTMDRWSARASVADASWLLACGLRAVASSLAQPWGLRPVAWSLTAYHQIHRQSRQDDTERRSSPQRILNQ